MSAPIIIEFRRPATVVVGKGQTVGSPIFVPSTGGSGGSKYTLATWEEYMQFKMYMNIKIGGMLLDKPSFDEIEKEQEIL